MVLVLVLAAKGMGGIVVSIGNITVLISSSAPDAVKVAVRTSVDVVNCVLTMHIGW
jgi:hypothetical protein